ncbi:MAG TPA: GNAT family N-acetyltransferase [Paucimonas sp.]|nr:GNAT family N-acetyltransferase [Paucimonas sp.]
MTISDKRRTGNPPIAAHKAIATDLMLNRVNGIVEQVGSYLVIRTPSEPDYYFGNLLVLERRPSNADLARLERDFARLVGTPPAIKHCTFMWPAAAGDDSPLDAFLRAGYVLNEDVALTATASDLVAPSPATLPIVIRPYDSEADWADWYAMQMAENAAGTYPEDSYRKFLHGKEAIYRRLIADGRGDWWGAFIEDRQVAHLGLFFDGDIGRFQWVLTAREFRGKGICRALVHHAARKGLERVECLVMVADEHYHAVRLYESLGFKRKERVASLCRHPMA